MTAPTAFSLPHRSSEPSHTYAPDFGARKMARDLEIMKLGPAELVASWEECVREAVAAKVGVEDEYSKGVRSNVSSVCSLLFLLYCVFNYSLYTSYVQTDHTKRTFDYEPFIREYIQSLQQAGLLNPLLDRDSDGKKKRGRKLAVPKR